jgi:hypothetical protein
MMAYQGQKRLGAKTNNDVMDPADGLAANAPEVLASGNLCFIRNAIAAR